MNTIPQPPAETKAALFDEIREAHHIWCAARRHGDRIVERAAAKRLHVLSDRWDVLSGIAPSGTEGLSLTDDEVRERLESADQGAVVAALRVLTRSADVIQTAHAVLALVDLGHGFDPFTEEPGSIERLGHLRPPPQPEGPEPPVSIWAPDEGPCHVADSVRVSIAPDAEGPFRVVHVGGESYVESGETVEVRGLHRVERVADGVSLFHVDLAKQYQPDPVHSEQKPANEQAWGDGSPGEPT